MTAGELRHRIYFDQRQATSDGYGNFESDFAEEFSVWGRVQPLKGGERVLADRLTGIQPVVIRVRVTDDTRQIDAGWRARADGKAYAITSPPSNMDEKGKYFDILATEGEAA